MVRCTLVVFALIGMSIVAITEAEAQVVTSYYGAPAVVPVAPVYGSAVVGVVPVRQGLFGLRTGYVPVLAPTAIAAPVSVAPVATSYYSAARPIISATPYGVAPAPYAAAYPYAPAPYAAAYPYAAAPYVPSAVVQSGYRGYAVAPLPYAPVIAPPVISAPATSFYPGAVMSMQ